MSLSQSLSSLAALISAQHYKTASFVTSAGSFAVHNKALLPFLREHYSRQDIDAIFSFLADKGTFHASVDTRTGLIRTSEALENYQMADRQWITDSIMCGYWQRQNDPEGWKKNLLVNAAFMLSPTARKAFDKAISNPSWCRAQKTDCCFAEMNGVPHIFLPASVHIDTKNGLPVAKEIKIDETWFNQKRLESQALLLLALSENLKPGILLPAEQLPAWAFDSSFFENTPAIRMIAEAISLLVNYLLAANRNPASYQSDVEFDFAAPSASSWEEIPYSGGMSSDTAFTVLALESVHTLFFSQQLAKSSLARKLLSALKNAPYGDFFSSDKVLLKAISAGRKKVSERITKRLLQGLPPLQGENRNFDTSLTFLAASGYKLDEDPAQNANLYLMLLQHLEGALLREHGMLRYAPHEFRALDGSIHQIFDSYLGIGFWLPESLRAVLLAHSVESPHKSFGSEDTSSLESMLARQKNTREGTEAQWCLGLSATLQGLCSLALSIIDAAKHDVSFPTAPERKMLQTLERKIDEYITRNIALISASSTSERMILKSNGCLLPAFRVMEAYEAMPCLDGKTTLWVPGAHPLSWGMAQLYDGLLKASSVKVLLEDLIY